MDIEGAERVVIPHIIDQLGETKYLVFEYHGHKHEVQELDRILGLLREYGFRYYLSTEDNLKQPFCNELPGVYDNRIVVYSYRR